MATYQAIVTKYHGPTNSRGSRISATAFAGRIYVSFDHALNITSNHDAAARALATKLGWSGRWIGGSNPTGTGNTYVSTRDECEMGKRGPSEGTFEVP